MTSRIVSTEGERAALVKFIEARELPFTVTVESGRKRSVEQNRLQRSIIQDIAEQLGDQTTEEVRARCKLQYGVPILRRDSEAFRAAYDKHIKALPYETKLAFMSEPIDWPVTRMMTVKQKTEYLDTVMRVHAEQGIVFRGDVT